MLDWIASNYGTVLVLLLVVGAVVAVICGMVKDKKQGKSSCGCSCGNCPMSGKCHGEK